MHHICACVNMYQRVSVCILMFDSATSWIIAHQDPLSMGFSRQEYCSELSLVTQLCPKFVTLWTSACQDSLSITNSQSLLKLMSTETAMPSNHFSLCGPLLLSPSTFPSTRVFYNESVPWIGWPKYWSFNFRINPCKEYSGMISFRMDWWDPLAVQGTFRSLLQQQVQKHQFFSTHLSLYSNSYIHTWLLKKP